MRAPRSRVTGLSPYDILGSILNRASYRNVADKRHRFQNDALNPNSDSAVALLGRLEVLHDIARFAAARPGMSRPGLPASYRYDRSDSASVLALVYFQMQRRDLGLSAGPQPIGQILADMNGIQQDGMLPDERRVIAMLEDHIGEKLPRRVEPETIAFNKSLHHTERYRLVDAFYNAARYSTSSNRHAALTFLDRLVVWRGHQSLNACQALAVFENDLKRLSPVDLQRLEVKFHVSRFPIFGHVKMVGSRTARIAMSAAASLPLKRSSPILQLDPVLAALVARKYDAYLTAQKTAIALKSKHASKRLLLNDYLSLI